MISRVLPELYREAGLHRMEPYFWALRSALLQSAQGDLADPRVVVLSPGTHSETAYDQAFVASALGFPLVQGSDLVVRDGWVWMRSRPSALERVDVILRRVDASWSDPLELRGDSQLGVAGLVEAVRRGRVRIVNGLGAGVLENPGLLPYLPAACEALLGEQLRLDVGPHLVVRRPRARSTTCCRGLDRLLLRTIDGPPVPGSLGRRELEQRDPRRPAPLGRPGAAAAVAGADLGCRRPHQRRGHAGAADAADVHAALRVGVPPAGRRPRQHRRRHRLRRAAPARARTCG